MGWLPRLGRRVDASETLPVPDDMRLLFHVVAEKRQRRENEGRHLFQELKRRRAEASTAPARAAVPDPVPTATVAPTPTPVATSEPVVASVAASKVLRPRRPRLPRLGVPTFASALLRRPRLPRLALPAFPAVRRRRRVLVSVPILAVAIAIVSAGIAYWTTGGSGSASASVGTLDAPQNVTASNTYGFGTVTVSWDGVPGPDSGDVDGYYVTRDNGSTIDPACDSSPGLLLPATPTTCDDTSVPDGTYTYTVTAVFRSWTTESDPSDSVTVFNDITPPEVDSITRNDPSPTNASSVSWTVTFTEDVTGVGISDFVLFGSGANGASITSVLGASDEYTVTANTGDDGTLRLDVSDDDSIQDAVGNPLGGPTAGDGDFTSGEAYLVDRTPPYVTSMERDDPDPTNASTVSWTVTFSEGVSGVDEDDFALTTSGLTPPTAIGTVTPIDDATYTVTASTGTGTPSGSGTIRLDVVDDNSIEDGSATRSVVQRPEMATSRRARCTRSTRRSRPSTRSTASRVPQTRSTPAHSTSPSPSASQ